MGHGQQQVGLSGFLCFLCFLWMIFAGITSWAGIAVAVALFIVPAMLWRGMQFLETFYKLTAFSGLVTFAVCMWLKPPFMRVHERAFRLWGGEGLASLRPHAHDFLDYLLIFVVASLLFGLIVFASAYLCWLLLPKTAEEKLLKKAREKRREASKADFSKVPSYGDFYAVPLGVSLKAQAFGDTGSTPVYLSFDLLSKHVCLVGTTGSGKTVTLFRFIYSALAHGKAIVLVDGKGDRETQKRFTLACQRYGRQPHIVTIDGSDHGEGYSAFSHGSTSELTDKVIGLFDWTEEHYRLGAQRFIQLLLRYLKLCKLPVTLGSIVRYSDLKRLREHHITAHCSGIQPKAKSPARKAQRAQEETLLPSFDEPPVQEEPASAEVAAFSAEGAKAEELLQAIATIDSKSIAGIRDRLATLAEGDMGEVIDDPAGLDLLDLIESQGAVLFSLDSLRYPAQARALGRLVVGDLKSTVSAHARAGAKPVAVLFDEFNIFASHETIDLINKSRSAGFEALLSFQSLADIDKLEAGEALRRQIIQNCNSIIVQRQNDSRDAEELSALFGTVETTDHTYIEMKGSAEVGAGSVRLVHEYRVPPDSIKELGVGQAWVKLVNAKGGLYVDKVQVKPD